MLFTPQSLTAVVFRKLVSTALLYACSVFAVNAQAGIAALSLDDAIDTRQLVREAPIVMSPNGEWVAYTVKIPRLEQPAIANFSRTGLSRVTFYDGFTEIWITNMRSRATVKLPQTQGSSWSPSWSPKGELLAFFSDRDGAARLWYWQAATENVQRVSDLIVRPMWGYQLPRWSPDGRSILTRTLHPGTPITGEFSSSAIDGTPTTDVRVFEWDSAEGSQSQQTTSAETGVKLDYSAPEFSDLTIIDITTGRAQIVASGVFPMNYWFSPSSKDVAYLSKTGHKEANIYSNHFDLVVVSLKNGNARTVAQNISSPTFTGVSWSPNATELSFTNRQGTVFMASSAGNQLRRISLAAKSLNSVNVHRAPLWDADGRFVVIAAGDSVWRIDEHDGTVRKLATLAGQTVVDILASSGATQFWSPDGGLSLIALTRAEASQTMALCAVRVDGGETSTLLMADKVLGDPLAGMVWGFDASSDGKRVLFISEDSQHPSEIWTTDASFRNPERLTDINPQLERYAFGETRMIEWKNLDGRVLRGALLLPPGYQSGKRYPLIVHLYGDSLLSRYKNRFGGFTGPGAFNLQILATRGYVILHPDAPLNTGTPMYDLAQTVLPGVNKAIELGIADADRLAVIGQSFGGYSALSLIVQTKRFKAAIVQSGYGDVLGSYGHLGKYGQEHFFVSFNETRNGKMGGTPWEYRERYIENSPVFYLDRVQTPVLLIHGTADDAVRVFQAEEVFVGLRRLGKTVTLAEYEGEGHGLVKRANIIDAWGRILRWLDKYLS